MKSIIKSIIKIVYVIVIPILYTFTAITVSTKYDISNTLIAGLIIGGVCVVLNSVIYLAVLANVRMMPKITTEFIPIFGLAFGVDPTSDKDKMTWLLLIPFVSFEFTVKK